MISVANTNGNVRTTGPFWASFFVVLTAISLLAGCRREPSEAVFSGATMGTTYHVKVFSDDPVPESLTEGIQNVLNRVDRAMTTYDADSELMRLNRAPVEEPVAVSEPLMTVLLLAKSIYEQTEGAFDPTVGPLVALWGFGAQPGNDTVPSEQAVAERRRNQGLQFLALDPVAGTATRLRPVELDLSAIAKGYGVDRVSTFLAEKGLNRHMVEVGGEVYLSGYKPGGETWRIAVERPLAGQRSVQRVLALKDVGLATSGDYRNYFERDGKRYSHTLDPRTGYPVSHGLASATVVTESAARSDALATAFMVMGPEKALEAARKLEVAVLLLVKDENGFREVYNSAMESYLTEAR